MSLRQLGFIESVNLLQGHGIDVEGILASSLEEVLFAADSVGYPVVLKAVSEKIIHKSDIGAVLLNLHDRAEIETAYFQLLDNGLQATGEPLDGILVQAMAKPGFELLLGAKQDPSFGPVTMLGLGGRYVELFSDAATGIGVLTRQDVLDMLVETKAGHILGGYRGQILDFDAVIELTIKVSKFMAEHPEIHEMDLNPVLVYEKGYAIVDSRLIGGEVVAYPDFEQITQEKINTIQAIFDARSVAIIGASRPGTQGGVILKNCLGIDRIYPIHPRFDQLHGLRCYPNLQALPEIPEVAVFAVNPERTLQIFEEFCTMGGKGAIIFSDGFAEVGRHDLEKSLLELSKQHNVPYIGPNCMGVIDNFSKLNTNFIPEQRSTPVTTPNGIGVISQSGGIGLELLEMFGADKLNIGRWVSIGNGSSLGVPEHLAYMGEDDRIKVIAIYLEGVADGLKLMEIGRRVTRKKPVLIIKGGVGGGAEAALSHTASMAGSHEAFKACCRQAGFYLVEDLTEDPKILVNVLSMLTSQPVPLGDKIAVVSVGGGAGILLADQVTEEKMALASFTAETRVRLQQLMGKNLAADTSALKASTLQGVGNNPIDMFGDCDDERLLEALRIIDDDPNTDVIITAIYLQVPLLSEYLPERLVDLKSELKKPLIISLRGFSDYVLRSSGYMSAKQLKSYTVPMIKPMRIALDIWQKYKKSFLDKRF
ncbi:acetate--CoA ligase family protein [Desulforhopalus singaporensis]|uniref:Acyl-CoA synthetase (NDP forming) n=1 Tax=Desulforhopalus singaporensis TaxID=91360 RepID=A0A1H0V073_9BACT|nr:acetate--CoA ligase family protein [Desulforhopalus singaporensis]SDP71912.1 Acyl-CoA synthetase (NDP forming) [Desulforhopalus singaporensis]